MLDALSVLRERVAERGGEASVARELASCFDRLRGTESDALFRLRQLESLVERVRSFDLRMFRKLRDDYQGLAEDERKRVRDAVEYEFKKLGVEKRLRRLGQTVVANEEGFARLLGGVVVGLRSRNQKKALGYLDRAIETKRESAKALTRMRALEKALVRLTRKELKDF